MNKFEEAIQIAKGVTNFLRMKANIANNDIEELHKRRYAVCKVCEFRNQIMINAIHADVLCN
jgi:predicted nucleic acid-binding protein